MGRKIPGKKHRGIKDPGKQRAVRFNSIKGKINAPPSNPEEQHIPKSLSRIVELKEKAKLPAPAKVKSKKPKPKFVQGNGETDKHFLWRINNVCESVIRETAFEEKYGVKVKRNPETGKVEDVVKRKKDELEEYMKKVKKESKMPKGKGKKKKKKESEEPKLSKGQKRSIKLKERKERKMERNLDEFKNYKENIEFGEIVHAPPTLPIPRRVQSTKCAPRPGQKDLLLKSVIGVKPSKMEVQPPKSPNKQDKLKTANKAIDKKGKRKNLPFALRRQLEKTQQEVMQVYRQLRDSKK